MQQSSISSSLETPSIPAMFSRLWPVVTDDNPLTLFGFRRFRTTHLLNLRFLEEEIATLDNKIYQAGFKLDLPLPYNDKLGLGHGKIDKKAPKAEDCIDQALIIQLRGLLNEYDSALASFNHIMMMETFALADNDFASHLRDDITPYETYKTRMVRLDQLANRRSKGHLEHCLRKYLRVMWFFFRQPRSNSTQISSPKGDVEGQARSAEQERRLKNSYQNTSFLADCIARLVIALLSGIFLVVPLVILSYQETREAHLITVSVCIVVFSFIVSVMSRASHQETLAASAAYAAVLVVFFSNGGG